MTDGQQIVTRTRSIPLRKKPSLAAKNVTITLTRAAMLSVVQPSEAVHTKQRSITESITTVRGSMMRFSTSLYQLPRETTELVRELDHKMLSKEATTRSPDRQATILDAMLLSVQVQSHSLRRNVDQILATSSMVPIATVVFKAPLVSLEMRVTTPEQLEQEIMVIISDEMLQ